MNNKIEKSWISVLLSLEGETNIWAFLLGQGVIFGLAGFFNNLHQYIGFVSSSWMFDAAGIIFSALVCYLSYVSFIKRLRSNRWINPFNKMVLVWFACLLFSFEVSDSDIER